jgi:hypothetical protein
MANNTNIEIKALGEANMPDNNQGLITPAKMRETFGAMLNHLGGNVYFVNSSTTPQTLNAGVGTIMANDGAGALSVTTFRPWYLDTATFLSGNKIHFDDVANASIMFFRIESQFVTGANTNIKVEVVFRDSVGTEAFRLQIEELYYKSSGTHKKTTNFTCFMDSNITNGTMEIVVTADTNATGLLKSIMADIR